MDRENAAGNFRCSTLSEDSLTAIALALHWNYESHSGMRARNISALKNLLLRIRDCLVSSASSSHGSYSSSVEPNGNGSAARYKYLCTSGRRGGARRREGRMGRGREGGRGHHARAACVFCFVSFVVVVVVVAVRLALTSQFDGR